MSRFNFDESRMEQLCLGLPKSISAQCFANTASRMIETDAKLADRAIAVCAFAQARKQGEPCYRELVNYSRFIFNAYSPEALAFCARLPAPWNIQCESTQRN
jgi:hypothetical protein